MNQVKFRTFLQQIMKTPVGILGVGILGTVTVIGSYRYIIKPKLDRERYNEAEAFANFLFEKENLQLNGNKIQ